MRLPSLSHGLNRNQTLPACDSEEQYSDTAGKIAGFSLHAGVATRADERKKLERFCRYISRPAVSEKRLSLTSNGNIRYQLKTPYRESLPHERSECFGYGTTHIIFEPLDFMARLATLMPQPRVNLARVHGVFTQNGSGYKMGSGLSLSHKLFRFTTLLLWSRAITGV